MSVRIYTREVCLKIAKKYNERTKWQRGNNASHQAACKYGKAFYKKCTAHMRWNKRYKNPPPKPHGYWTKERILKEALRFASFGDWKAKSNSSYQLAYIRGYMDEIKKLKILKGNEVIHYWSRERILARIAHNTKIADLDSWRRESMVTYKRSIQNRQFYKECLQLIKERR